MSAELQIDTPGDRELVVKRVFDAPPQLVFEAWTTPALLRQWYGPRGWSLVVCEIDLRVGGAWRFVSRQPSGREVGQRGTYREIVPGVRIVQTERWEDWDPGEALVTTLFEPLAGKTALTHTTLFPSHEVRETLLRSGLNDGTAETYARLDELVTARRS